jgi:hypothetical protein
MSDKGDAKAQRVPGRSPRRLASKATSAGSRTVSVNRAPVLTLWSAVVAGRLGFEGEEALSLGRAVAGLNAYSKGRRLGIFKPHEEKAEKAREKDPEEVFKIDLCGRAVPARNTEDGVRATQGGRPISAAAVERYLQNKFGGDLKAVRSTMEKLARAYRPKVLAEKAYSLYELFRPAIPEGTRGWGARGDLDLGLIARLAKQKP